MQPISTFLKVLTLTTSALRVAADAIASTCEQYGTIPAANFLLNNNEWGLDTATSGSQCTYLDYDSGNTVSWQASWTWAGGSSTVKSYPNAGLNMAPTLLSSITSMPSTWNWSYTGTDLIADVSYDAFLSSTNSASAPHEYEIMIWLGTFGGIQPIGYGTPIASPTIGGITWNLYKGPNTWTVYSFVATGQITNFSGDIMNFFNYLIKNQGLPANYYLQVMQAGTEPMTGSNAWFTVSPYTLTMNT